MIKVAFLATSLLMLLNGCTKSSSPAEMVAAANALDAKLIEAFNKKDVNALMEAHLNSPDLAILDETQFIVGWTNYKAAMSEWFGKVASLQAGFSDSRNIVDGDRVLGQHKWTFLETMADGTQKTAAGLYSDVKAFRDGKWVIVSSTWVKTSSHLDNVKAAERIDSEGTKAYNKRDTDTYSADYWNSPDLAVVDAQHLVRGFDAWKKDVGQQLKNMPADSNFRFVENQNKAVGDIVLGFGTWQVVGPNETVRAEGLYTNVKAKQDGKWVIVLEHYSDAPLQAEAPAPAKN